MKMKNKGEWGDKGRRSYLESPFNRYLKKADLNPPKDGMSRILLSSLVYNFTHS